MSEGLQRASNLHEALLNGRHHYITRLLNSGEHHVDERNADGLTALHVSIRQGQRDVVQMLLEKGANIAAQARNHWTPLHFCAESGEKEIALTLISRGADVEAMAENLLRPLHICAKFNQAMLAEILLGKHAIKDAEDRTRQAPLHLCAEHNTVETAKVLLRWDANKDAEDGKRQAPLHLCAKCNAVDTAKVLLEAGANKDAEDGERRTPLHVCARHNTVAMAKVLLAAGANKDAEDGERRTPLHVCAQHNTGDTAEVLLQFAANKDAEDGDRLTPLHLCAEHHGTDTARALISKRANVLAKNANQHTPLHLCARFGSMTVARALLNGHPNVDVPDGKQSTALHVSAEMGTTLVAVTLLENGARVDARNEDFKTALHIAALKGYVEIVKALLKRGARPELQNKESDTALHLATEAGFLDVVHELLKVNPESIVNIAGCKKQTPLHLAVFFGSLPIARALIDAGACTEAKDNMGRTPCDWVKDGETAMYRLLTTTKTSTLPATGASQTNADMGLLEESNFGPIPFRAAHRKNELNADAAERRLIASPPEPERTQQAEEQHVAEQKETESDQDSSCSSSEPEEWSAHNPFGTRRSVLKMLATLRHNVIFADNYIMKMGVVVGRPYILLAQQKYRRKRKVLIAFYWDEYVFEHIQAFHSDLYESQHVWKMLECLKTARTGFPPSIVFEKGSQTLEEWLRYEHSIFEKKCCLFQVLTGLKEAHGSNYVHGDLKPANITFFGEETKWKLTNWDGGRKAGAGRVSIPTVSRYSAPEMIKLYKKERQLPVAFPSLDIWSFGIIAYETLSGRSFFDDDASLDGMMQSLQNGIVEERIHQMEHPAEKEVLSKCLAVNSIKRWTVVEALEHCFFAPDDSTTVTQSERSSDLERSGTGHHTNMHMFLDDMHTDD